MLHLPLELYRQISVFSGVFRKRTWEKAYRLLIGAILCPGSRTVCNVLRVLGLKDDKGFDKYHAVLNRARWSALKLSSILLGSLVAAFGQAGQPLIFGIDETIERRRGSRITKRGIYRDPVRSSASHFVKCSGLRWMSLMLLTKMPWLEDKHYWALPLLSVLCPSEQYYEKRSQGRQAKKLTDWARQMLLWLGRYTKPFNCLIYLVGDGAYATYELMTKAGQQGVGLIARMKMNARLFDLPAPKPQGKRGPEPKIGKRISSMEKYLCEGDTKWQEVIFTDWYRSKDKTMLITSGITMWDSNKGMRVPIKWVLVKDPDNKLEPVLLACSHIHTSAIDVVSFFVRRWRVEVTFAEVRRHLGVETQRQWSDLAIERVTPVLMALKSVVCLLAVPLFEQGKLNMQHTAWYDKQHITFSDVLYTVRQYIWAKSNLPSSQSNTYVGRLRAKVRYLEQVLLPAVA